MLLFILSVLSVVSNSISLYVAFHILEGNYMFRAFLLFAKNTGLEGGGYYKKLTICEYLALRYLEDRHELSYKKLPQGGYNVSEYVWKKD